MALGHRLGCLFEVIEDVSAASPGHTFTALHFCMHTGEGRCLAGGEVLLSYGKFDIGHRAGVMAA
jgi:hypothetical protein